MNVSKVHMLNLLIIAVMCYDEFYGYFWRTEQNFFSRHSHSSNFLRKLFNHLVLQNICFAVIRALTRVE